MTAASDPPERTARIVATLGFPLLLAVSVVPMGTGEAKFHLLETLAAALGIALVWSGAVACPPAPLAAPLALLGLWSLASGVWAPDPGRAFTSLLWTAVCALVFVVASRFGHSAVAAVATGFLLVALPTLGHGLAQYLGFLPHPDWANPIRLAGTFVNSNLYAAFTGAALLLAAGVLVTPGERWTRRCLAALVLPAAAVSLPLTASRGSWAATLAGAVVLAVLHGRRLGPRRMALAATLASGLALLTLTMALRAGALDQVRARLSGAGSYSVVHRLAIYRGTLALVQAQPLGVGLGGFEDAFPRYRVHSDRFLVNYAHSDLLELLATLGIPGVALCLTLAARILTRPAIRQALTQPSTWAPGATIVLLLVGSAFDFPTRKPTLGLLAAATLGALAGGAPGWPRPGFASRAILSMALALMGVTATLRLHGESLRSRAQSLESVGSIVRAARAYQDADRFLVPGDTALARGAGALAARSSRLPGFGAPFLKHSESWYRIAEKRNPHDAASSLALAVLAQATGRATEARERYLRAAQLAPQDGTTVIAAATFLAAHGDPASAVTLAAKAMDLSPVRMPPGAVAELARKGRLPAETLAAAPNPGSPHLVELARELLPDRPAGPPSGLALAPALLEARAQPRWPPWR